MYKRLLPEIETMAPIESYARNEHGIPSLVLTQEYDTIAQVSDARFMPRSIRMMVLLALLLLLLLLLYSRYSCDSCSG